MAEKLSLKLSRMGELISVRIMITDKDKAIS